MMDLSKKGKFRHSALKAFLKCPGYFKLRYIEDKQTLSTTAEKLMGQLVHLALENMHNQIMVGVTPTLKQVKERFYGLWRQHYNQHVKIVILANMKPKDEQTFIDLGYACITNYYLSQYPFKQITKANEMEIEMDLDGYTYTGIIDRLGEDGEYLEINDYKTGSEVPTKVELKHDLQLTGYELILRQKLNYDGPMRQTWHFVRPQDDGKMRTISLERTPVELERGRERILRTIDDIEEAIEIDHFPFRPNFLCPWCEYVDECDAYREYEEGRFS